MDNLKSYLQQLEKLSNGVPFPYQTNFSFLSKYPYDLIKISVPQWVRIDGLGKQMSGTEYGWKLICIFNDILSPFDILNKDYVYLPENFNLAISWLRSMNKKFGNQ